jgi:hypothetical protein
MKVMNSKRKLNKLPFLLALGLLLGAGANRLELSTDESGERPDHAYEAMKFRQLQLQDEKGQIPADGYTTAKQHIALMKAAQQQRIKASQDKEKPAQRPEAAGIEPKSWTWLGPGNVGGRIRSIVIQPDKPSNMWIGSVSGGIWRSVNSGASWQPVDDFMANLAVSTMVMDPTNYNVMYAGTGEGFWPTIGTGAFNDGIQGEGVFKSTDGGVTWNVLDATHRDPNWFYVNRLAISPDGKTILAANGTGIWRSVNGGASWTRAVDSTPAHLTIADPNADIDFDPTNSANAIAGATQYGNTAARFSTDGGATWTNATFNPGASGRTELAYAPSNPTIVYASVDQDTAKKCTADQNGEVYRSTDGGHTYFQVNQGNCLLGGSGAYHNIIWVNPKDPAFVVVGGVVPYRSIDNGTTFTAVGDASTNLPHADHHMIVADPRFNNTTNRTAFFANDGGIFIWNDVGATPSTSGWANLNNNLGITQFYGAAGNPRNGVIIGGTQDNGTVRFTGPLPWNTTLGGDGGFCAADPRDGPIDTSVFYGEYINGAVFRSQNGGLSGNYIYCDPSQIDPVVKDNHACPSGKGITEAYNGNGFANFIAPIVLDPNDPDTLLVGAVSLWRSRDAKSATVPTWTVIKSPVSNGLIPPSNVPISAIAVSPNNSNFMIVGYNDGELYRTFSGTSDTPSWSAKGELGKGLPSRFVISLAIDVTKSPNWIYVTFGGFFSDNVYRSTDLGINWSKVNGTGATSLPNAPVRSLAIHPRFPNLLYAGTEVGIFTSEDAGATWEPTQEGPANVSVDQLFWLREDLVAVTWGRGVFIASGGLYVDPNYSGIEIGTFDHPFRTIPAALNAATTYRPIWIKSGTYGDKLTITSAAELRSFGGLVTVGKN